MGDWISLYAAIVSTLVAVSQLSEWHARHRTLAISTVEHFKENKSAIIVRISNLSRNDVRLDYVAYGTYERKVRRIWRADPTSLASLARLLDRDTWKRGDALDGQSLKSGDFVYGIVTIDELHRIGDENVLRLPRSDRRRCICIEHPLTETGDLKLFYFSNAEDQKNETT